jgi:DHA1 family inner membrane transport protein
VPLQHRLVEIDPANAGISLSWWASATYLGIAVAPLLGAAVLGVNVQLVPVVGAVLALAAIVVFLVGFGQVSTRASRYSTDEIHDEPMTTPVT